MEKLVMQTLILKVIHMFMDMAGHEPLIKKKENMEKVELQEVGQKEVDGIPLVQQEVLEDITFSM